MSAEHTHHQEQQKVPRDENHIFYAKDVAISGDSHENTKQLPAQGKLNVFIGDLINPKKCPKKGTEAYEAWRKGYERKISAWTESVNQGETIFLLGNHEAQFISALVNGPDAANIFLYSQKTGQEKGKATLNALGVAVPEEEITQSNYDDFRNKVLENQTLNEYFFMLLKYGQLYAIVNNVYFSHTLPVTDKQGRLFPLTKEGKRGMEAMDQFEQSLRALTTDTSNHSREVILSLATKEFTLPDESGKQILGPLWVREKQRDELLQDKRSIGRLIGELDDQARKKGAKVRATMHGHIHKGGEMLYGRVKENGKVKDGIIGNVDFSPLSQHQKRARIFIENNQFVLFCPSNNREQRGGKVHLGCPKRGEIFSPKNGNVSYPTPRPAR